MVAPFGWLAHRSGETRDIYAGDGVEAHITRRAHGIEELRYSPADVGEAPFKNAFVLVAST